MRQNGGSRTNQRAHATKRSAEDPKIFILLSLWNHGFISPLLLSFVLLVSRLETGFHPLWCHRQASVARRTKIHEEPKRPRAEKPRDCQKPDDRIFIFRH